MTEYSIVKFGSRWYCDGPDGRFWGRTKAEVMRLLIETGGRYDDQAQQESVRRNLKGHGAMITNLHDLADWLGEEEPRLFNHRLFKDTECGASLSLYFDWRDPLHNGDTGWESITLDGAHGVIGFTIQTIVEGSDATVDSDLFRFPVSVAEVEKFVTSMETEADALWHEANDEEMQS